MTKKEHVLGFDIKTIIISSFIGLAIFLVFCLGLSFLMINEAISFSATGVFSKAALFISSLICCLYAKKKGRGDSFLNCLISSALVFGYTILLVLMRNENEWNLAGALICLMLCLASCFLVLVQKRKNSKLHKKRKR